MVSDCFSLLHTLAGTPLIQVWRSFLRNTFNVHSQAQNTESKNTLQILQSAEFATHNIGWGIDEFFQFFIMMWLHSYKQ